MKEIFKSKMLWVNAIAILAMIGTSLTGINIPANVSVGLLAIINLILRIITKEELIWA